MESSIHLQTSYLSETQRLLKLLRKIKAFFNKP